MHLSHTRLPPGIIANYVRNTEDILDDKLSVKRDVRLFRLPYGHGWTGARELGLKIAATLKANGVRHFGWHIDSLDASNNSDKGKPHRYPLQMLRKICEMKGGVVLLHDIQTNTADNLDNWIKAIKCAGHNIVDHKQYVEDPFFAINPTYKLSIPAHQRKNHNAEEHNPQMAAQEPNQISKPQYKACPPQENGLASWLSSWVEE